MEKVFKPGLKEHFWAKDDGSPGSIDGMIISMYSIIKKGTPNTKKVEQKDNVVEQIKTIDERIEKLVSSALGKDAKEYAKFSSLHYLNKEANLTDAERESKKAFINSCNSKLSEETTMIVDGYIYKREKLYGQKKRGSSEGSAKNEPQEKRNMEELASVISTLFQAKTLAEKMASTDSSWKDNKLKTRKGTGKPNPANYTMDDIRNDLKTRFPKLGF